MPGSRIFTASYPTRSAACCGEPIEPGDDVCFEDDDLIHADCATEEHDYA